MSRRAARCFLQFVLFLATACHARHCVDLRPDCPRWKDEGFCDKNTAYMQSHCPYSCQVCHLHHPRRKVPAAQAFASPVHHLSDYSVIRNVVGADLGHYQLITPTDDWKDRIMGHVERQRRYKKRTVLQEARYESVRQSCQNYQAECTYWALIGECDKNPEYMREIECPLACFSCEELDERARCPIDRNAKNAWYPGDLNAMFERIVSEPYFVEEYGVTVLSRPSMERDATDSENNDEDEEVEGTPWILQLDTFFTPAEAQHLIDLGNAIGFERSTEVNRRRGDFVSDRRTSETAWCDTDECDEDEVVSAIFLRMQNLTSIPMDNSESLQFLHYEVGGYYKTHHDYIPDEIDKRHGPRILTVFLYLNDGGDPPLQGGGTNFDKLGITVEPKVGRAVVWPSVLNDDPFEKDTRTTHQALEVTQGVKYGANAWLHQRERFGDC